MEVQTPILQRVSGVSSHWPSTCNCLQASINWIFA